MADKCSRLKNREKVYDVIKSECIVFMVLGHASFQLTNVVTLFHMAVFFIISGHFWNSKYVENIASLKSFIIKRLKRLYIPFVISNIIFLIFNNLFLKIGLYTNDPLFMIDSSMKNLFGLIYPLDLKGFMIETLKILMFMGGTQFGGSLWFLRSLFCVEIVFGIFAYLQKIYKKSIINLGVLALFAIGLVVRHVSFGRVDIIRICFLQIAIPITAFYFGVKGLKYIDEWPIYKGIYPIIITICSGMFLYVCGNKGIHIDLSNGSMTTPVYYILITVIGYIFCKCSSLILLKIDFVNKICCYIGENTMPILILHLLAFKVVTYFQIMLYGKTGLLPKYALASFPTLIRDGLWPYIYTVVGIAVSLTIGYIYKALINIIKNQKNG